MVCKFIEVNTGKTKEELGQDNLDWGNYRNAVFDITKGEYSSDGGKTFNEVVKKYTKGSYVTGSGILLTTGATKRNSVLNIYDFAGNLSEYVLAMYVPDEEEGTVRFFLRGGSFSQDGMAWTVGKWGGDISSTNCNEKQVGFRITLIPTDDI